MFLLIPDQPSQTGPTHTDQAWSNRLEEGERMMCRYVSGISAVLLLLSTNSVLADANQNIQDLILHQGWYLTTASQKDGPSQARVGGAHGTSFSLLCENLAPAISIQAIVRRSGIIAPRKSSRSSIELVVHLKKKGMLSSIWAAFDTDTTKAVFGELVKTGYLDMPPDEVAVLIEGKQAAGLIGRLDGQDEISIRGEGLGQGLTFTLEGSEGPIKKFMAGCPAKN